jgi:thymidylate kinase
MATQWRRYAAGAWHRFVGEIVLFDRYAYDALAAGAEGMSRARRLRRQLLARSCPPPDMVILLDAPAEVLHARKPEHEPEVLELRRRRYLELARGCRRWTVVSADRTFGEVRRDVERLVWDAYAARARGDAG